MTELTAFLSPSSADSVWRLWVDDPQLRRTGREAQTEFPAGRAPTVAVRNAALAALGFVPLDPAPDRPWRWTEIPAFKGDGVIIVGETQVRPLSKEEQAAVPATGPRVSHARVTTVVRDAPTGEWGPVAPEDLTALLGPEASGWPDLGLTVNRGGIAGPDVDDQFRVFHGSLLVGFTEAYSEPGQRTYRAVVTTDREMGLPYGTALPALPMDPLRSRHEEMRRFLPPTDPDYPTTAYTALCRPTGEN